MKIEISTRIVILVSMLTVHAPAQTFTTLWNFDGGSDGTSEDPRSLILADSTLYGTTACCSSYLDARNHGTVFAVNTDGTAFVSLHTFSGSDGDFPYGPLILSGITLFGSTGGGGSFGKGTPFAVNTDGTGFTTLHNFGGGSNEAGPSSGVILSSNTLFGTTSGGGNFGQSTAFAVNTDGIGFRTLHNFDGGSDGANPGGGLILSSHTLYGTASGGRNFDQGIVFAVNTDGTGFTNLHSFVALSDGTHPNGSLVLSGNMLCGTTSSGGSSGNGTVFSLRTDGTAFKVLHRFTAFTAGLNNDGANPLAGLNVLGNTLHGTAYSGGSSRHGTVFQVGTDGAGFATLYSFSGIPGSPPYINSDGAGPPQV